LLRAAFPNLTGAQLASALQAGATALGSTVPDDTFGYGRVDALGALATFPAPTITTLPDSNLESDAASPAYPFTVSGTGNLHFSVASTNASLVPSSIVTTGAGISIAPSTCGTSTMSCTLSVTPTMGQGGTASVTLSVVDGANRSASTTMMVSATASPMTAATASASSGSGSGGGGALAWWELASLALLIFLRRRSAVLNGRLIGTQPKRNLELKALH
jgi:hypothetical protein